MAKTNVLGGAYDDLFTLFGLTNGDTDLGTFTGSTITDNNDIKGALQELETAVESGSGLYDADGSLAGTRVVTLNGNTITFSGTANSEINSEAGVSAQYVNYGGSVPNTVEEGMTWYNANTQQMHLALYAGTSGGVWTTGTDLILCRSEIGAAGTQIAGLSFGGVSGSQQSCTEEYNGGSWSAGGALATARREIGGAGTQTAGLSFGGQSGSSRTETEEYDGASWSSGGALAVGLRALNGQNAGSQTAALQAGGCTTVYTNCTQEYNGTSWSGGGNLNVTRGFIAVSGEQTAAISAGGTCSADCGCAEEYNGTSWSNISAILTTREGMGAAGNVTCNLIFAGQGSAVCSDTEIYNGISWGVESNIITARKCIGGTGTGNTALSFGGGSVSSCATTELYTYTTFTSCRGVWSAGNDIITTRREIGTAGTQTAALGFGGYTTVSVSCTEEYDGATWTAGGALATARWGASGSGTQTAGLAAGGKDTNDCACTEEYDGASWSAGGALATARRNSAGGGTQTAGLVAGGYGTDSCTCTEEYDGASWSAGGALIQCSGALSGSGTQTDFSAYGGYDTTAVSNLSCTEEYNGTTWSASNPLNTARRSFGGLGGAGSSSAALSSGGWTSVAVSCTEEYNGVSWVNVNPITVTRCTTGTGTQTAALTIGGFNSSNCNDTEEYTYVNFSATESVWTSGGTSIICQYHASGTGTQTAALSAAGRDLATNPFACVNSYNGTAWVAETAVSCARRRVGGGGTLTASIVPAGHNGTGRVCTTEAYDGSAWSYLANTLNEYQDPACVGTQTAYAQATGDGASRQTCHDKFDGVTWSVAAPALCAVKEAGSINGTQNGWGIVGGNNVSNVGVNHTQIYNGGSWSYGGSVPYTCYEENTTGIGIINDVIVAGGNCNGTTKIRCTIYCDGVAWTEVNSLINGKRGHQGMGSSTAGLVNGGLNGGTTSEEYTCVDFIGFKVCYI